MGMAKELNDFYKYFPKIKSKTHLINFPHFALKYNYTYKQSLTFRELTSVKLTFSHIEHIDLFCVPNVDIYMATGKRTF